MFAEIRMSMRKILQTAVAAAFLFGGLAIAQDEVIEILTRPGRDLKNPVLRAQAVVELRNAEARHRAKTQAMAKRLNLPTRIELPGGKVRAIEGFRGERPIYLETYNTNAAITTAANQIRNTTPYGLDGSGLTVGVWDGGSVRKTHQEFSEGETSRVILGEVFAETNHATHVAGTIAATGIDAGAQGMAPAAKILSYEFTTTATQRTEAAAVTANQHATKIYLSNHSYGYLNGWSSNTWQGAGTDQNAREETFGRYSSTSTTVDSIQYDAPYYLEFYSAGNDRNDNPKLGDNVTIGGISYSYDPAIHPPGDGVYLNGYSTVGSQGSSKNNVVVGSVSDAVNSTTGARDLAMANLSPFSGFGPTDDGRIKPDLVANGQGLYSTTAIDDAAYTSMLGTSMACPNATGSASLLVDQYKRLFNSALRSSTLKGLLIHTADDLGSPGPDYQSGWGLMNVQRAAELVRNHANSPSRGHLIEDQINTANPTCSKSFVWDGVSIIRATLCWTDPAGIATTPDDRTPRLVNNLNLKVIAPDNTEYFPFIMPYVGDWTPATLSAPATTGVNTVDPVEQVLVSAPGRSGTWRVEVTYTGILSGGLQDFGLLISGIADQTPPTLQAANIVDDRSGATIVKNNLITYTVAFSEDMDAATVSSTDFSNAGTATITIGNLTETHAGVFALEVTPISGGTLQLGVTADAVLADLAGHPLDTTSAILDDTIITVLESNTLPLVNAGPDQTVAMGEGSAWTPGEISPFAWYDASDTTTITASGGAVSQWRSKSGTNHANPLTNGQGPVSGTRTINGLNALDFDPASNSFLQMTSGIEFYGRAAYVVNKADTAKTQQLLSSGTTNVQFRYNANNRMLLSAGANPWIAGATGVSEFISVTTTNVNVVGVIGDNTLSFSANGQETLTSNTYTSGSPFVLNQIGMRGTTSDAFDGLMGEIIICDIPAAANRRKIEGYLAHKWGVQARLPADHPYFANPPANAIATLNGTATDAENHLLVTTWSVVDGPAGAVITDASALTTTAHFKQAGIYTLRLTANDGFGTTSDEVIITVKSYPTVTSWPTAATIVEGEPRSSATLSGGSASVAGSFSYDDPAAIPPVGTSSAPVTFTPTNTDSFFSISNTVNVTVLSAFNGWLASHDGGQLTFHGDANNDGLADGLAWLLGSDTPQQKANHLLPAPQKNQEALQANFKMLNRSARGATVLRLQYSRDLGITDRWDNHAVIVPDATGPVGGVDFLVSPIMDTDLNQIQVTLPSTAADGTGKLFLRLIADSP